MFALLASSLLAVTTLQAPAQETGAERFVGLWVLKSVTVNGKVLKDAREASGLLKSFGGVEIGATYKFRRGDQCVLNDVPAEYVYLVETRELAVTVNVDKADEKMQAFDVKFSDKQIKLRFKERGKAVEMVLMPEE